MNTDRVNKWLTLAANFGVIAGIIFLAMEVNQNNQMMMSQTRSTLSLGISDILYREVATQEIADLVTLGMRGEISNDLEQVRFNRLVQSRLRYHENVYYQYRMGLYDEVEFLAQRAAWKSVVFSNKGVVENWCNSRLIYSPDFATEIDSLLTEYKCDQ